MIFIHRDPDAFVLPIEAWSVVRRLKLQAFGFNLNLKKKKKFFFSQRNVRMKGEHSRGRFFFNV